MFKAVSVITVEMQKHNLFGPFFLEFSLYYISGDCLETSREAIDIFREKHPPLFFNIF